MKVGNYSYDIQVRVEFTAQDLRDLYALSRNHYDHACRRMSMRGGRIYQWSVLLASDEKNPHDSESFPHAHLDWHYENLDDSRTTEETARFRDIDRIKKMTEMAQFAARGDEEQFDRMVRLMMQCGQLMAEINRESSRLHEPGRPVDIAYRD